MSYMPAYAEIHYGDRAVLLAGSKRQDRPDGLGITTEGLEGWRSTPEAKVTLTERASGNGAHDIAPSEILYSARTVTIHWVALAEQHDAVIASLNLLLSAAGQMVRLRVVDGADDTYATGYVTVSSDAAWHEGRMVGTMTVVCPRPERLSWLSTDVQVYPVSSTSGGLFYGDKGLGLVYPLSYGATAGSPQSVALLRNRGSATAYPVITVTGPMPDGVLLVGSDGRSVQWSGSVGRVPLILDSRTQTASMGGVDVSRLLTRRGFPLVPAGGSLSVQLMTPGDGWATISVHDTYM